MHQENLSNNYENSTKTIMVINKQLHLEYRFDIFKPFKINPYLYFIDFGELKSELVH
jgi:hypothetical protein